MSYFTELKQELEECACPQCCGKGTLDDAEPGDMYFEEFICGICDGSGINPVYAVSQLIEGK
ncbi:anti-termination protein Q-like [Pectobacterium phage My1]|uniref:Antitermination protein Q n=1 Tax=Pectobacterium phage My1 TaxID=1204539 RepID=J9QNW4_9CAUD|nr:anti-termination protein Q-like [Pectobacterium phage My1]AFQ22222.1 hypothetical protein My1_063 [Pectobacterium phage My1]